MSYVREQLKRAPLVEVSCGVSFRPLKRLDPVRLGEYWSQRKNEFPGHEVHPAIPEDAGAGLVFSMQVGLGELRSWFVSQNESLVLQFQNDRFLYNWRRREALYENFDAIRSAAKSEFDQFSAFSRSSLETSPKLRRAEVSKLNRFVQGAEWDSLEDLGRMMPSLSPLLGWAQGGQPGLGLTFVNRSGGFDRSMTLSLAPQPDTEGALPVVTLNVRVATELPPEGDLETTWDRCSQVATESFQALIPSAERESRFGVVRSEEGS